MATVGLDPWRQRRVLVTGATGLLGGWLVRELLEREADVVAIVRDAVPRTFLAEEGLVDRITVCRGDICDASLVGRVLAEYEVQTVFHLAAQTIVPIANCNPLSTFETNIAGTWTVLEAARLTSTVGEVVVASSDKAYGESSQLPYREDYPLQGRTPYDVSKSCADLIAQAYAHTWALNVCVVRCGNLVGGGDRNFNRLVPGVIRDVMAGRRPVLRSDGLPVRDYIYVEDAARAYLLLAEAMRSDRGLGGTPFNFSLESPVSALAVTNMILELMHSDLEPDIQATARRELAEQFLDASAARARLGWQPQVPLSEGLARTVAWYAAHG
ncbi:MAG: NAD-dependent epimerase/dehydratase family protein [Acidimicrobiales bacterium]